MWGIKWELSRRGIEGHHAVTETAKHSFHLTVTRAAGDRRREKICDGEMKKVEIKGRSATFSSLFLPREGWWWFYLEPPQPRLSFRNKRFGGAGTQSSPFTGSISSGPKMEITETSSLREQLSVEPLAVRASAWVVSLCLGVSSW